MKIELNLKAFALCGLLILASTLMSNKTLKKNKHKWGLVTTLDSLQGNWINSNNPLLKWKINGKRMDEFYNDEDSVQNHHIYSISFSDTVVNKYLAFSLGELSFDTSALSGRYLVAISYSDSTVYCYEINSLYLSTDSSQLLVSDTWAKFTPTIFLKQQ